MSLGGNDSRPGVEGQACASVRPSVLGHLPNLEMRYVAGESGRGVP